MGKKSKNSNLKRGLSLFGGTIRHRGDGLAAADRYRSLAINLIAWVERLRVSMRDVDTTTATETGSGTAVAQGAVTSGQAVCAEAYIVWAGSCLRHGGSSVAVLIIRLDRSMAGNYNELRGPGGPPPSMDHQMGI